MEIMKEYFYINKLGINKKLVIGKKDSDGKYPCTLWTTYTGEYCGSGKKTTKEINEFLSHYGLCFDGE